jgi:hypothetical protein
VGCFNFEREEVLTFKLLGDVLSPPCGIPFPSLKFLKTKRKGFNILKAWKIGG